MSSSKNTYFVKDGIVFSNESKTLEIIKSDSSIEIDPSFSFPKSNEKILEEVDKFILENTKKIEIKGVVSNFSSIKNKLTNSSKKKVDSSDYSFIENTSQIMLIEGYISALDKLHYKELDTSVSNYLKDNEELEKRKFKSLKSSLEKNKEKISKFNSEIKKIKGNDLKKAKDSVTAIEKELDIYENKKVSYEEKVGLEKNDAMTLKISKLQNKIEKLEYRYNDSDLQIKIYETKIKHLKALKKEGKMKIIHPVLFVATLGLVYWMPFTDIKYKSLKHEQKIYSLKEKMIEIKRKIKSTQVKITDTLHKREEKLKDSNKKNENLINEYEKINIKISDLKKDLGQKKNEFDRTNSKLIEIDEKIKTLNENTKELEDLKKTYDKISSTAIRKKILDLRMMNKENVSKLKEYKSKIESQKINLKGEWVINL